MDIIRKPLNKIFNSSFKDIFVSIILGQRRIGKTTFIKNYLELNGYSDLKQNLYYLNFDELEDREQVLKNKLSDLVESHFRKKISDFEKLKVIFIDEAQKVPEIFEKIKIIYDEYKKSNKVKFVLSGSSALDLYSKSVESLAGRVDLLRIYNFNLAEAIDMNAIKFVETEFWQIFNPDISFDEILEFEKHLLPIEDNKITKILNDTLLYGSMPVVTEICKEDPNPKERVVRYLKNYKETYVEKDIRALKQIDDLNAFIRLFDLMCSQVANLTVKKELCANAGMSFETLQKYLSVLEHTFVISLLEPFSRNVKKRMTKSPKIYCFDNGLVSLSHGFYTLEQLKKSGRIGSYYENLVLNELRKHLSMRYSYLKIYFYRTSNDAEIDFILDYKKKVIPVEVKYTDQIKNIRLGTLKNFIKEHPDCDYGVIIYNGKFQIDKENKIVFFPIQYFAAL